MLKITEFVSASSIWPTAEDHVDRGCIPGLMRGYNIEVKTAKGVIDWMSCEYIYGEPEEVFNDDYHTWSRSDWGLVPTGRICFRGYGREEYDFDEREEYVVQVTDNDWLDKMVADSIKNRQPCKSLIDEIMEDLDDLDDDIGY